MRLRSLTDNLNLSFGRRGDGEVVGLDIQPGFAAAVQARVNGSIAAESAATVPLAADVVRDGEVFDEGALSDALRELFEASGLGRRVRVGVANQRTLLRTLELPPLTDHKELAAAVNFQAQDQVPMPLNNAVMDFHPLGVVDTPAGARQRVVLVAAQRDMVERLLSAVRDAGLTPVGVDLSAFALIRSLYRAEADQAGRVLYLNVDGLTNLAIAEGTVCHFTRVVGGGLEGMATELAERRGIALAEARELLLSADMDEAPPAPAPAAQVAPKPEPEPQQAAEESEAFGGEDQADEQALADAPAEPDAVEDEKPEPATPPNADIRGVLENGVRDISGEVRNSLDFHRSQEGGGEVSHVVLSGMAGEIPGFAAALTRSLGIDVRGQAVDVVSDARFVASPSRLAVATGLGAAEAPR